MRRIRISGWLPLAALSLLTAAAAPVASRRAPAKVTEGMLTAIGPNGGACPLKHTAVKAELTGPMARVTVVQRFVNPYPDKIEAVYTFPLPHTAAVDSMTMKVGDRSIRGIIKRREEAQAIYEAARQAGHVASLLDQERPNIFTQAVANIRPGDEVLIEISYVETLQYEDGNYEFSFPMVVGPRYNPRHVSDAARIAPPVTPEGTRAGHDLSLEVSVDAGVPIQFLKSATHDIETQRPDPRKAIVRLRDKAVIPNKDFVLQYDVSGARIGDALLAHRAAKGGFLTFVLQPPDHPRVADVTPKEIVFVLDTSGSMMGFPIEKAKEAMKLAIAGLNPRDTFNLITFAGDTHVLFPQPVPATPDNVARAQQFLADRRGGGGTEMMKAIRAALDPSDSQEHLRVVCFMTDGFVGNDMEIVGEVKKHPNARVFSFGIGSSINRFLLDSMARAGRGEVEYVGLEDDGSAAAKRFHERVRSPLLTDITIDWTGLPVSEIFPAQIPDLFSAKPVVVSGRYAAPAKGVIRLRGKMAGRPFQREIAVNLPGAEPKHDVLASLWARRKVDDLMGRDWNGMQHGSPRGDLKEQITQLGLGFSLMTQFTSFVAVEDRIVTEGGQPRRVEVPVEMPQGVSYEGVFGKETDAVAGLRMKQSVGVMGDAPSSGGGFSGWAMSRKAAAPPPVAAPQEEHRVRKDTAGTGALQQPKRKIDPGLLAGTGTVEVKIFVTDASPETLKKLKELGLEAMTVIQPGRILAGRIAVEKLEALAKLDVVRYIAPRS
ncbi:MAG: VIT and vWA domain-containing protein [Bryobacteraceae bacterium]